MKGFSLIELMVAMVIGLLATLVIAQMFLLFEGQKRTTSGGADAQTTGAIALYTIERDLRQAGYGLAPNLEDFDPYSPTLPPTGTLTHGILSQCATVRAYSENRASAKDFSYAGSIFAPVVINPPGIPAGDAGTDVILVNYGSSNGMVGKGVDITESGASSQTGGDGKDFIATLSRAGFNQGDLVLAVPPRGSGLDCALAEITGLPPANTQCTQAGFAGGATNQLNRNSNVSYKNYYSNCVLTEPTRNRPGGLAGGLTFSAGSKLYSLGPVAGFVSKVYAVRGGALTVCDFNTTDCTDAALTGNTTAWLPIASGVVALRAQYGKDTDTNASIDLWDGIQFTGTDTAKVIAVRLALVARNTELERDEVTTASPVWHKDAPGTVDDTIDISGSHTQWKNFRYRTAQSVVPLRNLIWGLQR